MQRLPTDGEMEQNDFKPSSENLTPWADVLNAGSPVGGAILEGDRNIRRWA